MDMELDFPQAKFKAHDPSVKRTNKACLHCRQRKAKCDLDSNSIPGVQCSRCRREGRECIPGETRRGRPRKSKTPKPAESHDVERDHMSQSPDDGDTTEHFERIQNPSDALGILAQVADNHPGPEHQGDLHFQPHFAHVSPQNDQGLPYQNMGGTPFTSMHPEDVLPYRLCTDGLLTTGKVRELVSRYATHYHPYFPIVPARTFDLARIADVALKEQHLLTAILTIASKDLIEEADAYKLCSNHMQKLISALVIGMRADVEAVEALLILAEWTPHQQNAFSGSIGRGEEDRAAWMYVGMALRVGYYLGIDSTSFRSRFEPKGDEFLRQRLVWAACYMLDRQISVRTGRAFWSRGPGPLTGFTRGDFPTLQPKSLKDENYASIFQATLELTQLFSNVHEVLYNQRGSQLKALLVKDYIKYIDDFRAAIKGWNSLWGTLTCSTNLKSTLLISYDYLRLYTNAFAFQATFRRPRASKHKNQTQRPTFVSIASDPDARFIYEALDAAKSLLVTVNNFVDPETCLRYMPLRFYLYIIYSAVFLYKARFLSVTSDEEMRAVRDMINETINRLKRAGVGTQHLGSRYARLLDRLWHKGDPESSMNMSPNLSDDDINTHSNLNGLFNNTHASSMAHNRNSLDQNIATQQYTANVNPDFDAAMQGAANGSATKVNPTYDFNWLDLEAVGQFALDDTMFSAEQMLDIDMMWSGWGFGIDSEMSPSSASLQELT